MRQPQAGRLTRQRSRRLPAALTLPRTIAPIGRSQWQTTGEAWTVVSTVLSGICIFGGAGFGLDHLFGTRPILLAAGLLLGTVLGVYLVYAKYFNDPAAKATPKVPAAAGWSARAPVADSSAEPHPPTPELANWPHVTHAATGAERRPGGEAPHAS